MGQRNTAEWHFPDLGLPFPQAPKTGETCLRKHLVLITAWQLGWPIPGGGTSPRQGLAFSQTPALWLLTPLTCGLLLLDLPAFGSFGVCL